MALLKSLKGTLICDDSNIINLIKLNLPTFLLQQSLQEKSRK